MLTSTGTGDGDYEWAESAGGIDVKSQRANQVLQGDGSDGWQPGMALEVVQELPADDAEGYAIGDVVFVLGDADPKGPAAGSAVVGGHNGATVQRNVSIGDETYDIYTFTDDSATDLSLTVDTPGFADVLVIAGGGGGSTDSGGGGGAGGRLKITDAYLSEPSTTVVVGSGGAGSSGSSNALSGKNGEASQVGHYFAVGGGHAGHGNYDQSGHAGGSGGGGSVGADGGLGTTFQGNAGGSSSSSSNHRAGGGGGASGPGVAGTTTAGGDGGPGVDDSLFIGSPAGSLVLAGGGGGGATGAPGGAGGVGGGSAGIGGVGPALNADPNTGGGGGGTGRYGIDRYPAGSGGSGIVIVRVKV